MSNDVKKDRRVFKHKGKEYAVVRPTIQLLTEANKLRAKTFNEELQNGTIIRDQLDSVLRKRGLWSDGQEETYQTLVKEINDLEFALAKGGMKLSEGKEIALAMKTKRTEIAIMLSSKTDLDSNTCEGRADSARFNFLLANCLVYQDSGEKYFPGGLDEYISRQDDEVATLAGSEFFYLMSETEEVDSKLAENKFLKDYGFVNDDYRLVDKEGRLVDSDGRHVDEDGRYITWKSDDKWVYVDVEGREINEDGDFVVEFSPFLDDDGNDVVLTTEEDGQEKVDEVVEEVPAS